jgi:hypothetical protein
VLYQRQQSLLLQHCSLFDAKRFIYREMRDESSYFGHFAVSFIKCTYFHGYFSIIYMLSTPLNLFRLVSAWLIIIITKVGDVNMNSLRNADIECMGQFVRPNCPLRNFMNLQEQKNSKPICDNAVCLYFYISIWIC